MVDVTIANPDGQSATLANGFTYVSDADGGTLPDGDPTAGGSPNELGHSGGCSETSGLGFSPWIALALLLCIVLRRGPFLNKRP